MEKCPKCGEQYSKKPLYEIDTTTGKKKWLWKNILYIDIVSLLMLVSILMVLIGTWQMIHTMREIESNPCDFCSTNSCVTNILPNEQDRLFQIKLSDITTATKPLPTD